MTATRVEHTIAGAAAHRSHWAAEGDPIAVSQSRLAAARAVWVAIALVDLGLFAASIPARWDRLHVISAGVRGSLDELGLSANGFATYNVALEITFALAFTL